MNCTMSRAASQHALATRDRFDSLRGLRSVYHLADSGDVHPVRPIHVGELRSPRTRADQLPEAEQNAHGQNVAIGLCKRPRLHCVRISELAAPRTPTDRIACLPDLASKHHLRFPHLVKSGNRWAASRATCPLGITPSRSGKLCDVPPKLDANRRARLRRLGRSS